MDFGDIRTNLVESKSQKDHLCFNEKYSRRDISLLMNCGRDLSSIMYGISELEMMFSFLSRTIKQVLRMMNYSMQKVNRIMRMHLRTA